ncbi:hypothetical protein QTN25_008509 [Entamoeba marina]
MKSNEYCHDEFLEELKIEYDEILEKLQKQQLTTTPISPIYIIPHQVTKDLECDISISYTGTYYIELSVSGEKVAIEKSPKVYLIKDHPHKIYFKLKNDMIGIFDIKLIHDVGINSNCLSIAREYVIGKVMDENNIVCRRLNKNELSISIHCYAQKNDSIALYYIGDTYNTHYKHLYVFRYTKIRTIVLRNVPDGEYVLKYFRTMKITSQTPFISTTTFSKDHLLVK